MQKRHFFEPKLHHEGMKVPYFFISRRERAWFEVSENHPKFGPSPFGHGSNHVTKFGHFRKLRSEKLNFATLSVKPQGNRWVHGAGNMNFIRGNVA